MSVQKTFMIAMSGLHVTTQTATTLAAAQMDLWEMASTAQVDNYEVYQVICAQVICCILYQI